MSRRPMRGSARLADVEPDMNVTPLVDIVLVLLIIFMVVAPRMNQDIQVDLPGIFNPDPDIKGTMDPLKVAIPKAGEYYIDDQLYNLDGVAAYLSERHAAEPLRKLVLRADAGLRYGEVRDIMARAQEIGFPGLSFLVGKRHKAGEEATSDVAAKESAAAAPADTGAAPGSTGPAPENAGQGN
ncbi:MAG TPA: biopolymer transporter ExbD [Candidatus Binatia bacterium]